MSLLRFMRLIMGSCVLALFWALFAWTTFGSWEASILAAFWSLIVAPLFVPPAIWWVARMKGQLHRELLKEESRLRDLVLRCVLHRSVLDVEVWILEESSDEGFFWYESFGLFPRQSKTRVVITRAWLEFLEQNPESAAREFEMLWDKIASLSSGDRRLRTLQMSSWMGGLFVLELLIRVLDLLLAFLGVRGLPRSTFWCQGWAWQLSTRWFASSPMDAGIVENSQYTLRVGNEPLYWGSLLLGIWSFYPSRVLHPTWRLLTREESLL
jgi:hypothetical protein